MRIQDEFTDCETDVRLEGKVAIVTGATSGAGLGVAKNLATRGAKVIIASRNATKLADSKNVIIESSGNINVVTKQIDFTKLSSIRNFVGEIRTEEPRLDILINNIGATGLEDRLTEDNLHMMMQVNYFGTFLLTYLLFPLLKSSAPSRVVSVSSLAQILGHIDFEHWNDVGRYSDYGFYCNAKLAEVLFTVEMDKRIKGSGVNVYSMDPGLVKTKIFNNYPNKLINAGLLKFGRPVERVATMPVYLAIDPKVKCDSGKHFRDCKEFYSSWFSNDTVLTERLWKESKKLLKISKEENWDIDGI